MRRFTTPSPGVHSKLCPHVWIDPSKLIVGKCFAVKLYFVNHHGAEVEQCGCRNMHTNLPRHRVVSTLHRKKYHMPSPLWRNGVNLVNKSVDARGRKRFVTQLKVEISVAERSVFLVIQSDLFGIVK